MRKLLCLVLLLAGTSQAQDFRSESMPRDRELPNYVLGVATQRWSTAQVNWYYNPANQPVNLSTTDVLKAIEVAAARWSGMCNVTFTYRGISSAVPNMYGDSASVDGDNVYGWGVLQGGDAAYSAVTKTWHSGAAYIDADIMMNTLIAWTIEEVEAIMTHELGHAIGLGHSDRSASVMFASPYHTAHYMRTLRGDDADGCAALYGVASTAMSNRTFNWAEAQYPQYLSPGLAGSGYANGYYYRYYPGSNSYVGTREGIAYFLGPDGVLQNMGTLTTHYFSAQSSGY